MYAHGLVWLQGSLVLFCVDPCSLRRETLGCEWCDVSGTHTKFTVSERGRRAPARSPETPPGLPPGLSDSLALASSQGGQQEATAEHSRVPVDAAPRGHSCKSLPQVSGFGVPCPHLLLEAVTLTWR